MKVNKNQSIDTHNSYQNSALYARIQATNGRKAIHQHGRQLCPSSGLCYASEHYEADEEVVLIIV
jgi:uncharacterized protein (DUF779 family)